ncbi:MAG: NADH-ubiquinone oxidoreductase-F iron-sulfur binding region domain-containing protein [Acidimicrobiales bacterium]
MTFLPRVLDPDPVTSFEQYLRQGGGRGLDAARRLGAVGTIDEVEASGLRGRGGAGFSTGRKWRTVLENSAPGLPATVVVNAAEGEPGSFKDRAILRRNPYRAIEGALVAARTVAASGVIFALKATFHPELEGVRRAVEEARSAGWLDGLEAFVVEGPSEYLYGEETALLEVISGRKPFPRITPPFRRGVDDADPTTRSAAAEELAGPGPDSVGAPTLVNNVETLSNVGSILAEGADWFRQLGTPESPGTIVCTITGRTRRHGVAEVPMGTPLSAVIDTVGGGAMEGRRVVAVMSGVANPLVPEAHLSTPLTYEAMEGIGSGLGAAGFIVFDDRTDLTAVAHGVSRFLSVESCGQCTPCKQDGLALTGLLDGLRRSEAAGGDLDAVNDNLRTVADEARCALALQHQRVVESMLALFPEQFRAHASGAVAAAEPEVIAPIVDIDGDRAVLDDRQPRKQPDWTFDDTDSGESPADRFDASAEEQLPT